MTSIIDRRRGHPRVSFEGQVQLLPQGSQSGVLAQASNLSESGMFVASTQIFSVGTPVCFEVPLLEHHCAGQGRVVWVQPGPQPGMGIAFEDLSAPDLSALRQTVSAGSPLEWAREAKVWFAGTAQPTRVQAVVAGTAVRLRCELGFLRLRSPVTLFFSDDEAQSYMGTLESASLTAEGAQEVPRLELTVKLAQAPAPSQTWTYWPPPPIVGAAEDTTEIEAAEPVPGEEVYELRPVPEPEQPSVSGAITARALPSPSIPLEPSVTSEELVVETDPELTITTDEEPTPEEGSRTAADWGLMAHDPSNWQLRSDAVPGARPARRRRRHLWLWLLVLVMGGLTVASMSYTKLWERVSDRLLPWARGIEPRPGSLAVISPSIAEPPKEASRAKSLEAPRPARAEANAPLGKPAAELAAPAAAAPEPAASPDEADEANADEKANEAKADEANADAAKQSEPPAAPRTAPDSTPGTSLPAGVTLDEARGTLLVSLRGSVAGAQHYPLANPDGVAINLPAGLPRVSWGDYRVQRAGFRSLWVRKRPDGGTHLRVLVSSGMRPELRITPRAVQVTLRQTSREAEE